MTRILVARLDSLGDVVVSGPAIRAVSATRDAEVAVLCSSQGAPAARLLPGVAKVIEWSSPWILDPPPEVTMSSMGSLVELVADWGPSEAVVLTSFHQSPLPLALLLRLAGVRRITGVSVDYAGSLLDVRLRPGTDLADDLPEPERQLQIAAAAGHILPVDDEGRLALDPATLPAARRPELASPYVVVHPGAQVEARAWPAERARKAVRLLAEAGWCVAVTGGPSEKALTAMVAGEHGVDLGGLLDVGQLARVLGDAAAVVVGNTGPAHLAAAMGTPIVSLFSPVVPALRWAPFGVPTVVLGDQDAACRDTRARVCPLPGHPCLAQVTEQDVSAAVAALAGLPETPLLAGRAGDAS